MHMMFNTVMGWTKTNGEKTLKLLRFTVTVFVFKSGEF